MHDRPLPLLVEAAHERAQRCGFPLSCEPGVGWTLAALAATTPVSGRVLEMGTGVGVGTAWLVHGLMPRDDVSLISIERDAETATVAARGQWPSFVQLHTASVLDLLPRIGSFDLIFADAQGGKWEGLDRTIAALRPGGCLLVDDMTPPSWMNDDHRVNTVRVRQTLLTHPELIAAELAEASGMILATRRRVVAS